MPRVEFSLGAPNYPVLNSYMRDRSDVAVITGPLGSGKTYGAIQRLMLHMIEQPPNAEGVRPSRFCAVRNTYPDLMSTTVKDFLEVFGPLGKIKQGGLEPPTFHGGWDMPDGTKVRTEVVFLALDREDAVKKLLGMQVTGFWLNELKELNKAVVDMADLRHGRYPTVVAGGVKCGWHGMWGDTNACDEDHWLFHLAEEEHPEGWAFFRQPGGVIEGPLDAAGQPTWIDNEDAENLDNLPDRYYTRGRQGKDPDWIRVMLCNQYGFVVEGKPVHPEYKDAIHCAQAELETDMRYPIVVGIDFGRTPAAVFSQFIEPVGRWHVIDEFVTHDMSAALFAPALKQYIDQTYPNMKFRCYGDPAGDKPGDTVETTPIEMVRAAGIPCQPAPSNNPLLRRAAIARPIARTCMADGKSSFLVSPKARITRKGLAGGFCFRRMKIAGDERYHDVPDKNMYSHPVEALEYGMLGCGEGASALRPDEHMRESRGPRQRRAARVKGRR